MHQLSEKRPVDNIERDVWLSSAILPVREKEKQDDPTISEIYCNF